MMTYNWLETITPKSWALIGRVILKALVLFAACNLVFALTFPMQLISNFSLYNGFLAGRSRFSYGEQPKQDNSVITDNLTALFQSHEISSAKASDEYRVIVLGDSGTWGWFLDEEETLSARLTHADIIAGDKRVVVYNLAYPQGSVVKDLLILDEALDYNPDAVLWMVSMTAMENARRSDVPLLQGNAERVNQLSATYGLDIMLDNASLSLWQRSIIGQRSELSNLLQLQTYGFTYAATGIDQYIPNDYTKVRRDLVNDETWSDFSAPTELDASLFSFDVIEAGKKLASDIPFVVINEPIFISDGANSDLRYNSLYPRWAYDQYREIFAEQSQSADWGYRDLWDSVPPERFTNSPLHYDVVGAQTLAERVGQILLDAIIN